MSLPRYDSYKDSGVEWIGEIPEGWEVKRLKYVVKLNPEILTENTDKDYEIQYIDIGNVEQGQLKLPPEELKFGLAPSRARRIIKFGDTIVSTVRTYLKAITYINSYLTNIICSTGFAVLRVDAELNGKYIFYVASTPQIIEEICSLSVGVSYPAISPAALGNINIWLPSLPEQTAIASFLDRKTAEIDQLIANKEKLITLYEEEKTAIINRAVTRGLDPAEPSPNLSCPNDSIGHPSLFEKQKAGFPITPSGMTGFLNFVVSLSGRVGIFDGFNRQEQLKRVTGQADKPVMLIKAAGSIVLCINKQADNTGLFSNQPGPTGRNILNFSTNSA